MIPRRRVAIIRGLQPDVPLAVVPATAHAPMLEAPAAFCAALEGVLDRLSG